MLTVTASAQALWLYIMTTPIAAHLHADVILECLLQQLQCHHHSHHAIMWMFKPGQRQLLSSFFFLSSQRATKSGLLLASNRMISKTRPSRIII